MEMEAFLPQHSNSNNNNNKYNHNSNAKKWSIYSIICNTVKMKRLIFISILSLAVFIYWVEIKFVFQDGYIVLKDYFSSQEEELGDFISWEEAQGGQNLNNNNNNLASNGSKEFDELIKKFQAQHDFYYEDPVCPLPRTPLFPEYLNKTWKPFFRLDCDFERNTVVLENDQVLRKLTGPYGENENLQCCVQEVFRKNDFKYRLTECQQFGDVIDVSKREILAITCNNSINFEANIPIKEKVQEKINHWSKFSPEERPFNVLIFGFDTTSRLQAYRSLPNTIALMKKLGFVDFKSYHSIWPATLPNFMGFLMGIPPRVHRIPFTCAKSYMSPFDVCPFIWKNFTEQNYVTSYVEDATQTFNFKAQSGFDQPPTDYYIPHFFSAIKGMRKEQLENRPDDSIKPQWDAIANATKSTWNSTTADVSCTSTESTPEYIMRYTSRIARKFKNTPFFSFSWMNYPFHDNYHTHKIMDSPLVTFLRSLMTQPEILDRTFIFFLSDHGDRNTEFSVNSFESYFERALPPLFIRVPDAFRRKFPQMADNLLKNSYRFVSAYDLHHTLLHLLSIGHDLSHPKNKSQVFRTVSTHKASLFTILPPGRDCNTARIQDVVCKCNVTYDANGDSGDSDSDSSYKTQMLSFLIQELNVKVQTSYSKLCEEWTSTNISRIVSHHKMGEEERLVTFTADPADAAFQASFKVKKSSEKEFKFELFGFSRMSIYGQQSWCIKIQSDADKEMKNFCYCREQLAQKPVEPFASESDTDSTNSRRRK